MPDSLYLIHHRGQEREFCNFGGNNERRNIDIVKLICQELGKSEDLITYVTDRKGHDLQYAMDSTKIETELGWKPEVKFEDGIQMTIQWYLDHEDWWSDILSGNYQDFANKC